MYGYWDAEDPSEVISHIIKQDIEKKVKPSFSLIKDQFVAKVFNLQWFKKSREVIDMHYELGNDFYKCMLDPETMA